MVEKLCMTVKGTWSLTILLRIGRFPVQNLSTCLGFGSQPHYESHTELEIKLKLMKMIKIQ